MTFGTFTGLPLHILVVHAVVVGLPVAALATAAVAVFGSLRRKLACLLVLLDLVMVGVVFVAMQSGKWFYAHLGNPAFMATHRALGLTLIWYALALLGAAVLVALVQRAPGLLVGLVAVVALVVAGGTVVQVVRVGDTGSRAVWGNSVKSKGG